MLKTSNQRISIFFTQFCEILTDLTCSASAFTASAFGTFPDIFSCNIKQNNIYYGIQVQILTILLSCELCICITCNSTNTCPDRLGIDDKDLGNELRLTKYYKLNTHKDKATWTTINVKIHKLNILHGTLYNSLQTRNVHHTFTWTRHNEKF